MKRRASIAATIGTRGEINREVGDVLAETVPNPAAEKSRCWKIVYLWNRRIP